MDIGLIILAGGESRRMGCDKALLKFKGKTFLECIVEKGRKAGFKQIILSTNTPEKYMMIVNGVTFVKDIFEAAGPLGGIHAGLLNSEYYYNFVVSCDTPLLSFNQLEEFYEEIRGQAAAIAVCEGNIEPLFGIYSKGCIEAIEYIIKKHELKIRKIYNLVNTVYVQVQNKEELYNINTPRDYRRIKHY